MPNGVIWGGAVEGSNQLGETVTCQAMTARPAGVVAVAGTSPKTRKTTKSEASVRCQRCNPNRGMGPPRTMQSRNWSGALSREYQVPGAGWSIADMAPADWPGGGTGAWGPVSGGGGPSNLCGREHSLAWREP